MERTPSTSDSIDELAEIPASWRKVTGGKDDDHVVLVGGKRPLREHLDDMAQKTRSACKRAKVTSLTFHQLRASYATLAADQGLPVGKLMALLGHADATTRSISGQSPRPPRRTLVRASVATFWPRSPGRPKRF